MPVQPTDAVPSTSRVSVTESALSVAQAEDLARVLRAIADPVRLRLLNLIATFPGGQACVYDLCAAFELTGPTISHHLKVLRAAGVIGRTRHGTKMCHWVVPSALARLSAALAPCPVAAA
ncbi:metalloregulator ArsR/SmtB family transcription factor [Kutzneria sp. NPDC051319]|uniref:ArsR/SmtB family transcription factor n=1 Tax=Kutzneria sp. NPDC051319 TaxID=3155047 RepID=UPI0034290441